MKNKKGFSLIELILYVALVSVVLTGSVLFAWDVIYGNAKSKILREVNQSIRFTGKRITYEIRNSSGINYINPGDLCLKMIAPERDPTRVYLSQGQIRIAWGGGSPGCTGMLFDAPVSGSRVTSSNLSFIKRSSDQNPANIEFSFTVSSEGVRKEWDRTGSFTGSAELRSL